ncbi:DUF397 domain-containing protein [Streptomyces hygroscopicus]|uniref:DUF397 domain-containing protein n=1 Tax=Streptomyces hygroscopicus TaxID=1912 RepID=UPI0007DB5AC5|nr:DUF397 domain-containing protein [Streptomyces sp. NBRC 109436]
MTDITTFTWHKSSYSNGAGGNCVEVAGLTGEGAAVRDSKDPGGPVIGFSDRAWGDFVAAVRSGRLG